MLITASEIITKSVRLYRQNVYLFLKYMMVLFIPTSLIGIVNFLLGPFFTGINNYGLGVPMVLYLIILILSFVVSLWISVAFIRVVACKIKNEKEPEIRNNLQSALAILWPTILISLITSLIVISGFILLIIPGLIFSVWFAFAYYAVIIDNKKPVESLKESKTLTLNRWWAVVWRLIVPTFIFGLIILVIGGIINLPYDLIIKNAFPVSSGWYTFIAMIFVIINTAINLFFTPLATIAPTILYFELKQNPLEVKLPILPNKPPQT